MASIKNLRLVVAISNFGVVAIPASMAAAMVSPYDRRSWGAVSRNSLLMNRRAIASNDSSPTTRGVTGKRMAMPSTRAAIGGQTVVRPPMARHSNRRADRFRQVATGF